jgi:riboflavin synthase alpha subunit
MSTQSHGKARNQTPKRSVANHQVGQSVAVNGVMGCGRKGQ